MRVKPERELMVFIPPPLHIFGMGGGRKKIWSAMKQFWRKNPGKNFHRKIFRVNYYFQCSIFFLILQRLEGMNMKIGWTSGGIMVLYIFEYLRHSANFKWANKFVLARKLELRMLKFFHGMEWSEVEWRILISVLEQDSESSPGWREAFRHAGLRAGVWCGPSPEKSLSWARRRRRLGGVSIWNYNFQNPL